MTKHVMTKYRRRLSSFDIRHSLDIRYWAFVILFASCTSACGNSVRISKFEIIGKNRMNKNNRARNSPNVPTYIDQSQIVPEYRPQLEGKKSRLRLSTMITYRSSHMPMLTTIAITKSSVGLERTDFSHSACG